MTLILWLLVILIVYALLLLLLAWISVHPFRIPFWISPGVLGAPHEEVEIVSGDGTLLRGWWVPKEGATSVMVMSHGYMMNRCELAPEAYQLWRRGVSCLLIDLRAHGKSRGKRCTLGHSERMDVKAAVGFARSKMPGAKVGLIGSSMGSAASAMALAETPGLADLIVLDSAFGRLPSAIHGWWRFLGGNWLSMALYPMPFLAGPMAGINPFKIDIAEHVAKFGETPVLFIHGARDNLAIPGEAQRNIDAATGPKEVVWFEGCGHSEGRWEQPEKYHEALFGFLERCGFIASAHG